MCCEPHNCLTDVCPQIWQRVKIWNWATAITGVSGCMVAVVANELIIVGQGPKSAVLTTLKAASSVLMLFIWICIYRTYYYRVSEEVFCSGRTQYGLEEEAMAQQGQSTAERQTERRGSIFCETSCYFIPVDRRWLTVSVSPRSCTNGSRPTSRTG